VSSPLKEAFAEVVYRAALALDGGDHERFLALCAPDFRYSIGAYSPEIRRPMVWLEHDKPGLQGLFSTLSRHHSDRSPLSRHVTVYTVDVSGDEATIVSALQVFRTRLDGGATELFAVGKLHDTARLVAGAVLLAKRHIQLDTRELGIGSHVPF
jgi:methanesulfonate monooxygenase small subunit